MASDETSDIYAETLAVFERRTDPLEPLTTPEVAEALGANRRTVYKRLEKLVERGELRTKDVGSRARVWWPGAPGESTAAADAPVGKEDGADAGGHERKLERYEHILQTVPDGVWALDSDDRFALVNDAYCELTGYDREDLLDAHATLVTSQPVNEEANAFADRMRAGELYEAAMEVDVLRADGTTVPVESRFTQYELDDGEVARCGVVRDLTDRKAREAELAASERRYRTLVDNFPNGVVTRFDRDLRYVTVGGEVFEGLGLEPDDLQGHVVSEILPSALAAQIEPHFAAIIEGEEREFEVTYDGAVRSFRGVPIRDESGDVVAGQVVSQDVTERRERERELEAQGKRLATLNHLYSVVRTITHAVIDQSSREGIERTVCESIADSNVYQFAWIAEVDPAEGRVLPRAEAGVEGYLDDWISRSIDLYDLWSGGPIGRSIRTGELHVTEDVFTDPHFDPWHEYARKYDYRSVAGVPIGHEGSLYGVLGLYADGPEGFAGEAREIISHLGDIVGHAIAATERKQALLDDHVIELQFQIPEFLSDVGVAKSVDGRITFDRAIPVEGGDVLAYGVTTDDGIDALRAIVAGNPAWKSVSVIERTPGTTRFVLRVHEPPSVSVVAENGGYLVQSIVENGDAYVTVHLPATVDVRAIVETVRRSYPELVMVARRQVRRPPSPPGRIEHLVSESLTKRQRATLEAAFHAGYFDPSRKSTGADVARELDISTSTFHQHLRAAQYKLVDGVVEAAPNGRRTSTTT